MSRRFKNNLETSDILDRLQNTNQVLVPTDRTNSFISVTIKQYMTILYEYLVNMKNLTLEELW